MQFFRLQIRPSDASFLPVLSITCRKYVCAYPKDLAMLLLELAAPRERQRQHRVQQPDHSSLYVVVLEG